MYNAPMFLALLTLALTSGQKPPTPQFYATIPAPLPMPDPNAGDPADILATKIASHEPDAGPALITALQACGFSIVDHSRKVIVKPLSGAGCGVSLEDYEVLGMLNLRPNTPGIKFKTMSDSLIALGDQKNLLGLHMEILKNWQDSFHSKNSFTSFFGRFIDDLSVHGENPWSIWGSTTLMGQIMPGMGKTMMSNTPLASSQTMPGRIAAIQGYATDLMQDLQAKLSAPNLSMQDRMAIMQTLQPAEMLQSQAMMSTMNFDPKNPTAAQDQRQFKDCPLSMIQFLLLTRRLYADAYYYANKKPGKLLSSFVPELGEDSEQATNNPDYTGNILDVSAIGVSTFYGNLVTTAENIGEGGASAVDAASTIGAWGKVIANFMNLQVVLDPANTAVQRRKDKIPGTPTNVTATVKLVSDSDGSSGAARAGRMMSWGLGADLTPPDSGPASGAQVNWAINETGAVLEHAAQFVSPGKAGDGQLQTQAITDKNGSCKIGIQATGQKEVKPDNSIPYDRYAKIEVAVSLKGANLYQDLLDAMSAVASTATGNLSALIKGVLPDMLNRTSLFSTKYFPLVIHDWTPPLYEGTFTLEVKGKGESHMQDDNETWEVNRVAKGKIYSIFRGYNVRDTLYVEGRGGYYFQIEDLHDVSVHDTLTHNFLGGGGCLGKVEPIAESFKVNGPVADLSAPYTLQAGQMELKSQHVNGADSMLVNVTAAWSLPCRYIHTMTDYPTESGIQNMDIPIKCTDTLPPHPQSLNGVNTQTQTVVIGGAKGEVKAVMHWELHKVTGSGK